MTSVEVYNKLKVSMFANSTGEDGEESSASKSSKSNNDNEDEVISEIQSNADREDAAKGDDHGRGCRQHQCWSVQAAHAELEER